MREADKRDQWTPAMRNRGLFWDASPDWQHAVFEGDGWRARRIDGLAQWLVSGDLDAASTVGGGLPSVGLWQVEQSLPLMLRIGRDRALVVSEDPLLFTPGWNTEGFAASDVSDGWAVIEISGDLTAVAAELTFADLASGSLSASTLCAGIPALLYRSAETTARLHVEAPMAAYLWQWLGGAAQLKEPPGYP